MLYEDINELNLAIDENEKCKYSVNDNGVWSLEKDEKCNGGEVAEIVGNFMLVGVCATILVTLASIFS